MINATSAFARACSGSMTEGSASAFDQYMGTFYQKYENLTGWLGDTVQSVKDAHRNFMDSRMWEFGNRINGKDGQYVGRFEIGYLSEVQYQQQATGFMRDYIMANPTAMALYELGRISGYDGDINALCNGLERENYYFNKAMDGKVHFDAEEKTLNRTVYTSSRDNLTHLTFAERVDIHRTWQATNLHLAKELADPTNVMGGNMLTMEEVEEMKKKLAQEAGDE